MLHQAAPLQCVRFLGIALGAAVLAGCGTVSEYLAGDDNVQPPAELEDLASPIGLRTVWSRNVGSGPEKYYLRLGPAVADGRVFAANRKGGVTAYDAATGDRIWETKTKVAITGGPGTGAGVVAVGSSEGDVIALSPEDGALLWKVKVSSEVLAAPRARDATVIVRTVDGKLYALSALDGEQRWVYDRGVPALTLRGTSAPALAPGMVVAGFDSGLLVALSLSTGQPLWETRVALPTGRSELDRMVDIDADVVIDRRNVFTATFQGRTVAVDLDSGTVLWRRDMSAHAGLSVDDGTIFITDEQSHIWALDRDSSASLWRQSKLEGRQLTAPAAFKSFVVVGDFEGYVHWMRREDGQLVGRERVDGDGIIAAPVAAGELVYVYGRSGKLSALRPE